MISSVPSVSSVVNYFIGVSKTVGVGREKEQQMKFGLSRIFRIRSRKSWQLWFLN